MLTKEETKALLLALLLFATTNRLSAAQCSRLFGCSHPTMARWLRAASTEENPSSRIYRYMATPITDRLDKLNEMNTTRGTYAAIAHLKAAEKVDLLEGALAGRIVW